ncbi:hypothetical protein [Lentzea sp. NPDC055074]
MTVRDVSTALRHEIRTVSGETLFLSWEDEPGLVEFRGCHGFPDVVRFDVWGNLFEPFLDTSFTDSQQAGARVAALDAG